MPSCFAHTGINDVGLFLKFSGAPKKWAFFKGVMNIIDVLSILPYFVSVFLIESSPGAGKFIN